MTGFIGKLFTEIKLHLKLINNIRYISEKMNKTFYLVMLLTLTLMQNHAANTSNISLELRANDTKSGAKRLNLNNMWVPWVDESFTPAVVGFSVIGTLLHIISIYLNISRRDPLAPPILFMTLSFVEIVNAIGYAVSSFPSLYLMPSWRMFIKTCVFFRMFHTTLMNIITINNGLSVYWNIKYDDIFMYKIWKRVLPVMLILLIISITIQQFHSILEYMKFVYVSLEILLIVNMIMVYAYIGRKISINHRIVQPSPQEGRDNAPLANRTLLSELISAALSIPTLIVVTHIPLVTTPALLRTFYHGFSRKALESSQSVSMGFNVNAGNLCNAIGVVVDALLNMFQNKAVMCCH